MDAHENENGAECEQLMTRVKSTWELLVLLMQLFYNLTLCQNEKSDPTLQGPSLDEDTWERAQGAKGEA